MILYILFGICIVLAIASVAVLYIGTYLSKRKAGLSAKEKMLSLHLDTQQPPLKESFADEYVSFITEELKTINKTYRITGDFEDVVLATMSASVVAHRVVEESSQNFLENSINWFPSTRREPV